jgi:uroporphyrinogen-III decarboxylase
MKQISTLLDTVVELYGSDENKRRLSLWESEQPQVRGEIQWHGIPSGNTVNGDPMPITAETQISIWTELLGFSLDRYFKDPEYFLENYLKMKIKKYQEIPDDTPIDLNIPIWFGVAYEAALLGQEVFFPANEEPVFGKKPIITESTQFSEEMSFENNEFLLSVKKYYHRVRDLVGSDFNVIFPRWFRGPQGVALYIRGFTNFLTDICINPDFAHRILRYVTDAQKAYIKWESAYLDKPIEKVDLFNDDIPLLSPEHYRDFIFPYEQELCNFTGGVYYWHSCGDISRHIPEIIKLNSIDLLDFGVSMEDKSIGLANLEKDTVLEFRVLAQKHIQGADETEMKEYMQNILQNCKEEKLNKYILRTSGMSTLLGVEEDIRKLVEWIRISRDLQA